MIKCAKCDDFVGARWEGLCDACGHAHHQKYLAWKREMEEDTRRTLAELRDENGNRRWTDKKYQAN